MKEIICTKFSAVLYYMYSDTTGSIRAICSKHIILPYFLAPAGIRNQDHPARILVYLPITLSGLIRRI
jgi:hypothetical protein